MSFDYLSINNKAFRAVANEEFLTLEFRRAWIIFCSFCAGELGCPNNLKAIAKAAMLTLAEAEMFRAEMAELVEERDGLIAPLEVWRAVDRAAGRSHKAREAIRERWKSDRNTNESKTDTNVSKTDTNVLPTNPKPIPSEGECEGEGECECEKGDMRTGAPEAAPLSLESELDDLVQAIEEVTGVNPKTGWQVANKVRGVAIQVRANGDTGTVLRELVRVRGRPYRLNFLLEDYQEDKIRRQLTRQGGRNGVNQSTRTESAEERRLRELAEDLGAIAPAAEIGFDC